MLPEDLLDKFEVVSGVASVVLVMALHGAYQGNVSRFVPKRRIPSLSQFVRKAFRFRLADMDSAYLARMRAGVPDAGEEFRFRTVGLDSFLGALTDLGYGLRGLLRSYRYPVG